VEGLQVAAWRWIVGIQPAEGLPNIATDALVDGLDTPSLRELAGASGDDYWLIKELFERTINELGLDLPDEQTALWRLAQQKANEIVSGSVAPSAGAHWIWSEICNRIEREGDLRIFIGLADEWDDHPRHRPELEADIVRAAEQLTAQREPRRWIRVQARQGMSPVAVPRTLEELPVESLPVSDGLIKSLTSWAGDYDDTFVPGAEGFNSESDADAYVARGQALVNFLQDELGEFWHVEYMPEPRRRPGVRIRS
jgi:hypothetical protein